MTLSTLFTEHPSSVNETYVEHMEMSATFSFWLFVAGFCALVHAVFPFMFEKTGSNIISKLHGRMVTNRVVKTGPLHGAKKPTVSGA
ncbi:DUF6356 family protein [Sneathiella marina]|uniref:DUF6356 family protein n=1 Tax=Sneathiella marina TaxID=2950108 RepID=A0ABY4W2A6_9PROT|nr:DUF6356 family protein [Sneathiella marina]USG59860.1 DUF6356 family protein [Sneathiella marina]